ncbi:TorF family putative porin [Blastomonas sp.]|uniref:TorF family putative porin n=1 Tax=Blastomonas sp. TaxID=1909299 RepID=UPI0035932F0F
MRTSKFQRGLIGLGILLSSAAATPAFAQDEEAAPPVTVSGSVGLVSDYRFRGVSQSDEGIALQGGFTVAHESGLYAGTWASNLAGWGTFGGANLELDIFAGYAATFGSTGIDVGVTWYMYPSGANNTDFFEGYAKLKGTAGPVALTAAVFYAPKQEALGNFSNTPFSRGQSEDNLYLAGDASIGIPDTPVTINGHIGYSDGNPGLGPNGTSIAPTGKYWDWSIGAAVNVYGPLTLSVSYIDTDITRAESAFLLPNFSKLNGGQIADATVVVALTAAF